VSFGLLAAVFGAGGLIYNGRVSDAVDAQQEAADAYNTPGLTASEYETHFQAYEKAVAKAEDAADTRNVLYVLGGVFAAGFTLSIWF
jgi:hypothetical protein